MKSTHYKTCNFIMKLVPIFVKITIQSLRRNDWDSTTDKHGYR